MAKYVKTLVVVLACTSALICVLALGAFAAPNVNPAGTRVTFIGQSNPNTKDQSSPNTRGGGTSLDLGVEY
ncbi:hypothetical protein EPA93_17405 [Ktedonosporobacter rubrisoli]|uniref:Uncharacterized protein n=1 Tax=Ktedonosporobacter rubrisoli TaxID=2509675 RepID=A0A4P6JR51_KTERU|nr:hypothetical protein [Ktedonosporobacter rubrisoli]QBD77670.1 hypothetical protein EPA93_17405 [Ktedonosporobacter rubrisoli]